MLETASEPLALLLTAGAVALAVIAPRLHYHQFGEPSRMAREAGLSALLVGGILYVVFCSVKTVRREIESGTMQMALSHPISRASFFTAKIAGVYGAFLCFFWTLCLSSLTAIRGAEIGAEAAAQNGSIPLMWGPSFAFAVSTLVVPGVLAAILNRFFAFRFVPTAACAALATAAAGVAYRPDFSLALRYAGAACLLAFPPAVFASVSGAAAVRLGENAAAAISLAAAVAGLPFLGVYYVPAALSKGGSVGIPYILQAFASSVPFAAAALLAGAQMLKGRDIG